MTKDEKKKWIEKDGFYHCWFCEKPLTDKDVIWVGNIKRPVCEKHKDDLAKILAGKPKEDPRD